MDNENEPSQSPRVPDVLGPTHSPAGDPDVLFTSLRVWIDWVCHNWGLPSAALLQHPVIVMELDTAWRSWRRAWGDSGTVADKSVWFRMFAEVCGRIYGRPRPLMAALTSDEQFWPMADAPSGTLGSLAAPTGPEREAIESAVLYRSGESTPSGVGDGAWMVQDL